MLSFWSHTTATVPKSRTSGRTKLNHLPTGTQLNSCWCWLAPSNWHIIWTCFSAPPSSPCASWLQLAAQRPASRLLPRHTLPNPRFLFLAAPGWKLRQLAKQVKIECAVIDLAMRPPRPPLSRLSLNWQLGHRSWHRQMPTVPSAN